MVNCAVRQEIAKWASPWRRKISGLSSLHSLQNYVFEEGFSRQWVVLERFGKLRRNRTWQSPVGGAAGEGTMRETREDTCSGKLENRKRKKKTKKQKKPRNPTD